MRVKIKKQIEAECEHKIDSIEATTTCVCIYDHLSDRDDFHVGAATIMVLGDSLGPEGLDVQISRNALRDLYEQIGKKLAAFEKRKCAKRPCEACGRTQ